MKLGFITNHPVGTSETFVYELIRGLELEYGPDNIIHLAGNTVGKKVVSKSYFSNFGVKKKHYKHFDNLERVAKLNWRSTFKLRRREAEQAFEKLPKSDIPEVVYIEFGQPAVLFRRYLEHHRIPMVVHFHGMDASSAFNSSTYREEIQQVFQYATNIITASHHIRRLLVLQGCPPEKIRVVRYGIKVAEIKPKSWEQRAPHPAVIFLGRLTEKKSPLALVHAFNLVKNSIEDARLTIIGDGPLKSDVGKLVKKLGLTDSITMHGELAHDVALEKLSEHWVFAQHSVTASNGDQEGYALSPAEAAAYELPVVSTLHNGIPEHVIDGVTGFLVREFDYETMAEKIVQLLQDRDLSIKMGQNGRRNILELNNPQKRIESITSILQLVYNKRYHL